MYLSYPAAQQATGEAKYIDDNPLLANELHAALVLSTRAHARILAIDTTEALCKTILWQNRILRNPTIHFIIAMDGVVGVYSGNDVPGKKRLGPLVEGVAGSYG